MKGSLAPEMFECVPEIQFNIGYRYFLGNMDNYTKAILSTLKSIKSKLSLLESMVYTEEFEGLRTISQTLRIMLSNIGAVTLAEETYQIELIILNGSTNQIREQLADYVANLIEFSDHLELLLKKSELRGSVNPEEELASFLNYDFTKTRESIRRSADFLDRRII